MLDIDPVITDADTLKRRRRPPVRYSPEIGVSICERLEAGESLLKICSTTDMPTESAVRKWTKERTEFGAMYAHAREAAYL